MSNNSPIFPMPEPQHFSDYGFDPQIDYFQVLEEARKHKRESSRSIDSLHFRLQKPISKEESRVKKSLHNKAKKRRWWRNAFLFFKWKWIYNNHREYDANNSLEHDVHHARARAFRASMSGPVYATESRSGSCTPCRSTNRPSSVPLAGTLSPVNRSEFQVPYLSLRELNMEQQQHQRMSTSSMPIYLVT